MNNLCLECAKPLPRKDMTYCSKKCFNVKKGQRDRPRYEEEALQANMENARAGDTDAQEAIRQNYGVVGLLKGSGYATVEEALDNVVRFG